MSHLLENIAGMGSGGFGFLVDRAEQGEMSRSAGRKIRWDLGNSIT
jgi:hypothetical protein